PRASASWASTTAARRACASIRSDTEQATAARINRRQRSFLALMLVERRQRLPEAGERRCRRVNRGVLRRLRREAAQRRLVHTSQELAERIPVGLLNHRDAVAGPLAHGSPVEQLVIQTM